jgi:hypothetical protein
MDVFGTVTNDGNVNVQAGRTVNFYNAVNGNGNFTGTGTVAFLAGYSPGHSPAAVSFAGNVTLGGGCDLTMELGGTTAGSTYDQITAAGTITVGGILDVPLINSFVPQPGETFQLFKGTISGTFAKINLPAAPTNSCWDTDKLYTSGVISTLLSGDANADSQVNGADYAVWAANYGASIAGWSQGDFNNDDQVNGADYAIWAANYGASVTTSGTPEPISMIILAVGGGFIGLKRHIA